VDETPMMPKGRYKIMRAYMPKKGTRGLDMMFRTCTIQVNLDFESEEDMIRKFRTSLALQPVATAMFANSAFKDGADTGYQSMRSDVWKDTDDDRTGTLGWVFDDDFGFKKYCDYVMDVPMYFLYRNGTYVDVSGESWHDFMEGKLPQLPGDRPTIDDWEQHLTTVFPEVRLKKYMEMRGADGGSFEAILALPALWVGLLYSEKSLAAAEKLVSDWTQAERDGLRNDVTKDGLSTKFRDGTVNDIAKEMVRLAIEGLKERGQGEEVYMQYLTDIVNKGQSNAAQMSALNATEWKGNISKVYEYTTFPDVLPEIK
jgi:glutamate--cysteine ligase